MKARMIARTIKDAVAPDRSISVCYMYGSATANRLAQSSDIDVAVAGSRYFSEREMNDLRAGLATVLGREVDLIDLQRIDGPLLQEILTQGEAIKLEDDELLARLIKRMWYFQADMLPNLRMILEQMKVVPADLRMRLQKAVGFRKVAVHEYEKIDWDRAFSLVSIRLEGFKEFSRRALLHFAI